jgi:hypothetical protein
MDRYGHLDPEADSALRGRLDALYGSAQPAPASPVVRLPWRAARGPAWPRVHPGTTKAPPMVLRRRPDLRLDVVGATGLNL